MNWDRRKRKYHAGGLGQVRLDQYYCNVALAGDLSPVPADVARIGLTIDTKAQADRIVHIRKWKCNHAKTD
jgi:hypothetical protein